MNQNNITDKNFYYINKDKNKNNNSYIVEEPDGTFESSNDDYWLLYSPLQKKRFKKVLYQFNDIWNRVYTTVKQINLYSVDDSNEIMLKIHRLYIIQLKDAIDFYNNEKINNRRVKNYISRKIKKMRNAKQQL
jgi:hypothetical protein